MSSEKDFACTAYFRCASRDIAPLWESSIQVIAIKQSVPLSAPAKEVEFSFFSLSRFTSVAVHYDFKVKWLVEVSTPCMIFVSWLAYISLIEACDHKPPIGSNWLSVSCRQGQVQKIAHYWCGRYSSTKNSTYCIEKLGLVQPADQIITSECLEVALDREKCIKLKSQSEGGRWMIFQARKALVNVLT